AAETERVPYAVPEGTFLAEAMRDLTPAADGAVSAWDLHAAAKAALEAEPGLHLLQASVDALVPPAPDGAPDATWTLVTWEGVAHRAAAVGLCVGTFLRACWTSGDATEVAGRPGEMAYDDLADDLAAHGVRFVRDVVEGGGADRPAWRVTFDRFAPDACDGPRLVGFPAAYAAGRCVHGRLPYLDAARDGARLADAVARDGVAVGGAPPSG
ncbi:MAG: FAD-dependent oxidoreductase, partial [Trueperaceae bacterium]|nr:FAD-dependent oxidoreductase [Trueperaceae bacterium]